MDQISDLSKLERERLDEPAARPRRWRWWTTAIGVASGLPISIDYIARWAAGLEARGVSLTPVSALISRGTTASARVDP